jgi:hypothetical protein
MTTIPSRNKRPPSPKSKYNPMDRLPYWWTGSGELSERAWSLRKDYARNQKVIDLMKNKVDNGVKSIELVNIRIETSPPYCIKLKTDEHWWLRCKTVEVLDKIVGEDVENYFGWRVG